MQISFQHGAIDARTARPGSYQVLVDGVIVKTIRTHATEVDQSHSLFFEFREDVRLLISRQSKIELRDPLGSRFLLSTPNSHEKLGFSNHKTSADLFERLNSGWVIDKWGSLKLPFGNSALRKENALWGMNKAIDIFEKEFSTILFPCYGTLLGLERCGGLLPHDDDIDMSFYVSGTTEQAVVKFYDIAKKLREFCSALTIIETGQIEAWFEDKANCTSLDIFLSWGQESIFNMFFAVSGTISPPMTFSRRLLEGKEIQAPTNAREILELTYGPNWLTPDPDFQFHANSKIQLEMENLSRLGHQMKRSF